VHSRRRENSKSGVGVRCRNRLETSCQPEQFVLFGFSDGGTSVWREIRHPYEAKYLVAVTDSTGKVRNPAYFGVIDMVRRWYIRPPLLRLIGELPNTETDRETESELNATLQKPGSTIVENYRNNGYGRRESGIRGWRGFILKGVSPDHRIEQCYHTEILNRVHSDVVQNAISAYRSVQP
jgi:hypothetical protein